jgi:hypothetical protein
MATNQHYAQAVGESKAEQIGYLDALDNSLGMTLGQLRELAQRARSLADRVLGPQPEPVAQQQGTGTTGNYPAIRRLGDAADNLRELAHGIGETMKRLENL